MPKIRFKFRNLVNNSNTAKLSKLKLSRENDIFKGVIRPSKKKLGNYNIYQLPALLFLNYNILSNQDYRFLKFLPYKTLILGLNKKRVKWSKFKLRFTTFKDIFTKDLLNKKFFSKKMSLYSPHERKNLIFFSSSNSFDANLTSFFFVSPAPVVNTFINHE